MKKASRLIIHILTSVSLTCIFIILLVMSLKTATTTKIGTDNAIDKLNSFYIEELAKNRATLIADELEEKYNYVNNALSVISQKDLESPKSLRNYLGNMRKLYGVDIFALVDENGLVYTSHSTSSGKTQYPFLAEKITKPIYSTVLNYGGEKQLFLAVPVSGLYFNNSKITACFVEINIAQMMRSMTYHHDNMDTYFNLYYKNGESLTNSEFGNLPAGQNLFSVLTASKEDQKNLNKVQDDYANGFSGSAEVTFGNESAHIYYIPVKDTGWMLTILVYENAINDQVSSSISLLMKHTRVHVFFTVALILVLFLSLVLIIRSTSQFKIAQEKIISHRTKLAYEKLDKEQKAMHIIHSVLKSGPWTLDFDENGNIIRCDWSDSFRQLIGYTSELEFPNKMEACLNKIHPNDRERVFKAFWDSVNDKTGKLIYDVQYQLLTKDRGWRWFHASGNVIRNEDGSPQTFIGLFIDVDDIKRNEINLNEQFNIVNALSRDYANVLSINLSDRTIKPVKLSAYVPKAFKENDSESSSYDVFFAEYIQERVYTEDKGFMKKAIALDTVIEKLTGSDEYSSNYRIKDNGEVHFYEFKYMKLSPETVILGVMNIDKIVSDAKEKEKLIVLSETDRMTGLLNRVCGELKVEECLKRGEGGLFILIDIDNFKSFNDTYGHDVGDQVIINVANCLKAAFRENDIVFRLGGDEFSAYAPTVHDKKIARTIIKRFIENLKTIVIPELGENPVTASIGATIITSGEPAEFGQNYKLVDGALYQSKMVQGSCVTFK